MQHHSFSGRFPSVAYVVSEELAKASSLLPSNKHRSLLVHSLVSALGVLSLVTLDHQKCFKVLRPRRATQRDLLSYHTRDYLEYTLDPSSNYGDQAQISKFGLEDDCPPFRGMHEYIQLVAGATLTAVDAIKEGLCDVAVCWDGGRHHAQKSHASGFCYVADCVLAILALRRAVPSSVSPRKSRVMYLDLDLHFSDAVSQAFHNPSSTAMSQVLTLSIHHAAPGFFPVSPLSALPNPDDASFDPFTLSMPLREGASSQTFARIWPIVEGIKDIFLPDFIIVQCGVDGLAGDPTATWNWSLGGPGSLGWCIERVIHGWSGKKLLLGGGGYNSPNAARAWAFLTSIAAGKPLPLETQIPDHRAFPLYQPSFTLDVPAGNMQEQNSKEYLQHVEDIYERIQTILQQRLSGEGPP
ncbi:arginase deacetylase [Paxillus ammoniavirescens]|nr:arginase deacetylase [Paxillus ammoniavirescens]